MLNMAEIQEGRDTATTCTKNEINHGVLMKRPDG